MGPSSVASAILRALSLDPDYAKVAAHGGSGFASTYRLTTPTTSIFVKISPSAGAARMFEGEYESLNAIHSAIPSLCPRAFAWGTLDKGDGYFLATEFIDMSFRRTHGATQGSGSGMSLAQKLAKLHTTPAPTPEGYSGPQFGFSVVTCCGDTPQPNTYTKSWSKFFAQYRLMAILDRCEENNGKDPDLHKLIEQVIDEVVPRLLGDGYLGGAEGIKPVVVHGDLWSGNKGRGSFVGRGSDSPDSAGATEDVVFDPSACYAHSEFEHGIMSMFGGFGNSFWREYFASCPKTEPQNEYPDRVNLYESYHHLNHHAIFGGYRSGAVSLLRELVKKYGTKT